MEENPRKTHLINFSLRTVISEISIAMYGQPLKVPSPVKFLGVIIGNHSSMKLRMEHVERARLVDRMNITRRNSTSATILIRLHKMFARQNVGYGCTALTTLNKSQRHRLQVIQNRCLRMQEE